MGGSKLSIPPPWTINIMPYIVNLITSWSFTQQFTHQIPLQKLRHFLHLHKSLLPIWIWKGALLLKSPNIYFRSNLTPPPNPPSSPGPNQRSLTWSSGLLIVEFRPMELLIFLTPQNLFVDPIKDTFLVRFAPLYVTVNQAPLVSYLGFTSEFFLQSK